MSSITVFEQIKSELRVDPNGQGFCSIRGAARLADVDQSRLSKSLKWGEALDRSALAVFLVSQGIEGEALNQYATKGIPDIALGAMA